MKSEDRIPGRGKLFSIIDKVLQLSSGEGRTDVTVSAYWQGNTRWFRNRIGMSSNRTDYRVTIRRIIDRGAGTVSMNQTDEQSVLSAVKFAEWKAVTERKDQKPQDFPVELPENRDSDSYVWGEATANYDFIDSGKIVRITCQRAEDLDLITAGSVECTSFSAAYYFYDETTRKENRNFTRVTRSDLSITARHPQGLGSGWGGISDVDFARINEETIASKAFDRCLASMNPVRVEPGRYTAILESQAVADMIGKLLFASEPVMDRASAEWQPGARGPHPFYLGYDEAARLHRSKLGLKVFDARVNVWHDPLDPELGVTGFTASDVGIKKVSYVENGVLRSLSYERRYSVNRLEANENNVHRMSFRMSGGSLTIEEMIDSTERGFLVTRFSDGSISDSSSLAASGLTRDGLWLIENGKIKSAVRNFRTLESPFFILNNLDQLGLPEKVFTKTVQNSTDINRIGALYTKNFAPQIIVPPLKVLDFSFTATIDAV